MSNRLSIRRLFNKRMVAYLTILLVLQCIIAYGALTVFDMLPESITGVPSDRTAQRESQQGLVNLIRIQLEKHKDLPVQEAINQLQPLFSYPLEVYPRDSIHLRYVIKRDLKKYGYSYDDLNDFLYIKLKNNTLLRLGPNLMPDILESNMMSFGAFLFLWSLFSAAIFFLLIYFAFSQFWRDLTDIRQTAEQLGQGNLKARAENTKSWLFKPLAKVLNNMGTHIEHSVRTHQIISQAMAHELRTPLARMRFELSMLDESKTDEERMEFRKGIDEDIDELESLINASLNYFKIQKIKLNLTPVSLIQWGQKLCDSLELLKPDKFELICNAQDDTVTIDVKLVETIIKNLVLNAFKYAAHMAILNLSKKDDMLVIELDDDGPGIPLESREEIFIPFARLDTSRTSSTGGYGLGLAYVKLIAELHNGKVFVVTSPLGGSRFVVTLKFND